MHTEGHCSRLGPMARSPRPATPTTDFDKGGREEQGRVRGAVEGALESTAAKPPSPAHTTTATTGHTNKQSAADSAEPNKTRDGLAPPILLRMEHRQQQQHPEVQPTANQDETLTQLNPEHVLKVEGP